MQSHIECEIAKKQYYKPYIATIDDARKIMTNYDVFPNNKWYKGQYLSSEPHVDNRYAGWRPLQHNYKMVKKHKHEYGCYEGACSTLYPCILNCNVNYQ
jgi:hypothetical protein